MYKRISDPIPVSNHPSSIAIDSTTNIVYITNRINNTVSVINGTTDTVIHVPIRVDNSPIGIAVSPGDGHKVYVANFDSDTVFVK